jgi:hypothetical protein
MAAMSPNGKYAGLAQTKYVEARTSEIPKEDRAGVPLPPKFGVQACRKAYAAFTKTPYYLFEKPCGSKKNRKEKEGGKQREEKQKEKRKEKEEEKRGGDLGNIIVDLPEYNEYGVFGFDYNNEDDNDDDELVNEELQTVLLREAEDMRRSRLFRNNTTIFDVDAFKYDPQNVHDHGVSTATGYNLRRLSEELEQRRGDRDREEDERQLSLSTEEPTSITQNSMMRDTDEVRRKILACRDLTPEQRESSLYVVDSLSDLPHSTYGVSEREALLAVWHKIKNSENSENLTETLAKQLASGVERGSVVCSSGKIARITSSLDGTFNGAAPKPMWAIREEIGSLAAKIRNQHEDEDEESTISVFKDEVKRKYIDELGMSPQVIEPIIEEYSMGF